MNRIRTRGILGLFALALVAALAANPSLIAQSRADQSAAQKPTP